MVLVNGANMSSGGGFSILRAFYMAAPVDSRFLVKNDDIKRALADARPDGPMLTIAPAWADKYWALLFFYSFWLQRFCKKTEAEAIISLGNISARVGVRQTVYLHWGYFAYGLQAGGRSDPMTYLTRLIRYGLIRLFIGYADRVVVQTHAMAGQLVNRFGPAMGAVTCVVYPGFETAIFRQKEERRKPKQYTAEGVVSVIFPALFYPHKNFELVRSVGRLIDAQGIRINISLTLPEADYDRSGFHDVKCVRNLGVLSRTAIDKAYFDHDGLFMPTRFETFGLPYLEAMAAGLPIVTSDKDFSREICGDYAIYFDAEDAGSAISALECMRQCLLDGRDFIAESRSRLMRFPTWDTSVSAVFNMEATQ